MGKKSSPRLMVFFDTNALYTQVASDLVKTDVARVIEENTDHVDLLISWHLPQVVVDERRYQMQQKGHELLPNLRRIERLLGHNFAVAEDTLDFHIDNAIQSAIEELGLYVAPADVERIDWADVILRATQRRPPFESGEKEKGFRDCIIAESFLQAYEDNPSTPTICRLIFVTSDERLKEFIEERTNNAKNVRIVSSIEELESFINTLVSNVSEEFAKELEKKASELFFKEDNKKSLFYKEALRDQIRDKYGEVLKDPKIEGARRENGTWWISEPLFVKKDKQRVSWISMIEPEFEIFHFENDQWNADESISDYRKGSWTGRRGKTIADLVGELESGKDNSMRKGIGGLLSGALNTRKVVDMVGNEKFEVHWSASISQARNLVKPSIDEIKHVGDSKEDDG